MKSIKLVQQPCDSTCSVACLSMLSGITVRNLQDRFKMTYPKTEQQMQAVLYSLFGSKFNQLVTPGLIVGRLFMVTVPSLNHVGGIHRIILEKVGDNIKVYDPNTGRKDKKYYSNFCVDRGKANCYPLHSWSEVYVFDL